MSETNITISKRTFKIIEGVFLCLLAVILSFNIGYVCRTVAFPLIYLFGTLYYGFNIFLFVEGVFLLVKGEGIRLKHKILILPIILLCLSVLMLATSIMLFSYPPKTFDIINEYNGLISSIPNGYYGSKFVNLFSSGFGGGIIGYILTLPIISSSSNNVALTTSIILVVCFAILSFLPIIIFAIKGAVNTNKKIKDKKAAELQERYKNSFVEESNVILHADEIGQDEVGGNKTFSSFEDVNLSNRGENISNANFAPQHKTIGSLEEVGLDSFRMKENISDIPVPASNESQTVTEAAIVNETFEEPVQNSVEEKIDILKNNVEIEQNIETNDNFEKIKEEPIVSEQIPEPAKEELETVEEVVAPVSAPVNEAPIEEEIKEEPKEEVDPYKLLDVVTSKNIKWVAPSASGLQNAQIDDVLDENKRLAEERMAIINETFANFEIAAKCVDYIIGPSITRFLIDYESKGLVKNVDKITDDLSRLLNGVYVRFDPTVKGTRYSGLEVANGKVTMVSFKEIVEVLPDPNSHPTAVGFGKDIAGNVIYADIAKFPHLLVSGTSGSGKSVYINSIISTLLMRASPNDVRLVLVDPKRVEMSKYRDTPHLLCPIITQANEAKAMLYRMIEEMDNRYALLDTAEFAADIKDYNEFARNHGRPTLPYIVVILDEYADLALNCKDISTPLCALTQKARAVGIHIIVSTQRPSTDVITGTVKANLNTRISLTAASAVDSITVLDEGGAQELMGNGDMLVKSPLISSTSLVRLQSCYIKNSEIAYIVNYLKENYKSDYLEKFMNLEQKSTEAANQMINSGQMQADKDSSDEDKYNWIKEYVMGLDYVSMSKIQRECSIGFNHAGKVVKRLQEEGIVSSIPEPGNKGFKVLQQESRFLGSDDDIPTSDELTTR